MRQPQFKGLRTDKKPHAVHREKPRPVEVSDATPAKNALSKASKIEFSHLDKVFFPKHYYTKGDLIAYYESVASYILPLYKGPALFNAAYA